MAFPVAVTWRLLRQEQEPTRQFSRLLDLFDMAVRFAVVVLIADLVSHKEMSSGQPGPADLFRDFVPERPSLGDWVNALPRLLTRFRKDQSASSFSEPILRSFQEAAQIMERRKLVHLRNETKGHALTLSAAEYEHLFQNYSPDVEKVIEALMSCLSRKWRVLPLR
jgi:hypothetical protein